MKFSMKWNTYQNNSHKTDKITITQEKGQYTFLPNEENCDRRNKKIR